MKLGRRAKMQIIGGLSFLAGMAVMYLWLASIGQIVALM